MWSYTRAFYMYVKKFHELVKIGELRGINLSPGRKCKYMYCIARFVANIFSVMFCRWAFRLQTLQKKVNFGVLCFNRCYLFRAVLFIAMDVNSVYFYDDYNQTTSAFPTRELHL